MDRVPARYCFLLVAAFCAPSVPSAVAADDNDPQFREKAAKVAIASVKTISTGSVPIQAIRVLDDNSVLAVTSHFTTFAGLKKAAKDAKRPSTEYEFGWSVWELSSGRRLHGVTRKLAFSPQGAFVSPEGSWVGVLGTTFDSKTGMPKVGFVTIWKTKSGQEISSWKVTDLLFVGVAVDPSGKHVALATQKFGTANRDFDAYEASVQIWRVSKGKQVETLFVQRRGLLPRVTFDQRGKRLCVSLGTYAEDSIENPSQHRDVILWRTKDWKQITRINNIYSADLFPPRVHLVGPRFLVIDGGFIGSGSMQLWSIQSKDRLAVFGRTIRPRLVSHLSPTGDRIAFLNKVGSTFFNRKKPKVIDEIALVELESGSVIARLREPKSEATAFSFTKDGRQIISGSSDGGIRIWNLPPSR